MDNPSRAVEGARTGTSTTGHWYHRHHDCNEPVADSSILACPDCDFLQRIPAAAPGTTVKCQRCGRILWQPKKDSANRTLALTFAALALYIIANSVPMLGLNAVGRETTTTVAGGTRQMWNDGQKLVAVIAFFAVVISPALEIGFLLLITLGAQTRRPPFWVGLLLRNVQFVRTWSMIEVMLLGVLVALTKISEIAMVIPGLALFTLFVLVMLLAAIETSFDPREVWDRIEWASPELEPPKAGKS